MKLLTLRHETPTQKIQILPLAPKIAFCYNAHRSFREKGSPRCGGSPSPYVMGLCPITFVMAETTLSIFVDEFGSYAFPDRDSRFYIVGLVFHDQRDSVADLVCTLTLIERKLEAGLSMTRSEMRFFGGPRDFKRNILKKIKSKELL